MTQQQIQQLFQLRYNQNNWKQFLGQAFANARLLTNPETLAGINADVATKALRLGFIVLNEDGIERHIAVYEVTLAPGIVLERNRVGLRNLLRKYWKDIDAAFIVYHRPENHNWRFTYVSELTGFDAEGELIQVKTEPKRYTYILGEGESCRTAAERFAIIAKKGSTATLDDVKDAFSVEKLSKAFFEEYKVHYENFVEFLTGKRMVKSGGKWPEKQTGKPNPQLAYIFNGDEKEARDFNKKLLGRIVFLYFIQKKGWMGVPEKSEWGQGDPNFLWNLFDNSRNKGIFYSEYLSKLFFDTLNTQRTDDLIELVPDERCRIPYLNGGLFEEDNKKYRNLIFPAELFENLFEFFNKYNFTIYEDDPNDHTVAVDPEMLGHIFENLLEDNKDKGAYYTPKEIVHYMCQESLIEYLTTWFENKGYEVTGYIGLDKPDQPQLFSTNEGRKGQGILEIPPQTKTNKIDRLLIEKLLKKKLDDADKTLAIKHSAEFISALDSVKICDPAIGSGAFPMGLLKEIFTAKQTLYAFENGSTEGFDASGVKLNIIQNSIYGVDIEKGAVDIARLRFWLSLIVDDPEPKALPNLDYKIVVGNSLVSKLGDDIIDIDWSLDDTSHGLFGQELVKQKGDLLKKISREQKEFFNPESDKNKLAADIRKLKIDLLINQLELMVKTQGLETRPTGHGKAIVKQTEQYLETIGWKQQIEKLEKLKVKPEVPLQFFEWKLDFPEIMNEQVANKIGFDIVIGNPPYVGQKGNKRLFEPFKNNSKWKYFYERKQDIYYYFIAQGISLLNSNGYLSYINPPYFLTAAGAENLRKFITKNASIDKILNLSYPIKVFENVSINSLILFIHKGTNRIEKRIELYEPISGNGKTYLNKLNLTISKYSTSNLTNNEWYLFKDDKTIELNSENTINLGNISTISPGIQTGADKVSLSHINKYKLTNHHKDKGIYVVSNEEYNSLNLSNNEESFVKPFYKNSELMKWNGQLVNNKWIIITNSINNIDNCLNIKEHLLKYKLILDDRYRNFALKNADKEGKWWALYGYRPDTNFDDEKILFPYRGKNPKFSYSEKPFYSAMDIYYITNLLTDYSYKYILGILNSHLLNYYFKKNCKKKGNVIEFSMKPMKAIPIKVSDDITQNRIVNIVDKILALNSEDATPLEQQIDNMVYKLYELTYEEVKVIDPEFGLSEHEYEAVKV